MTIQQIIIKRTGMSAEDAAYYEAIAEARVRAYLNLPDSADISAYKFQICDIAVLYWQKDQSTYQSSGSLGYSRQSFSEGGVSETNAVMNGNIIQSTYDSAINDVLASLKGETGIVRFI